MTKSKVFLMQLVNFLSIIFLVIFCSTQNQTIISQEEALKKIYFDINMLNEEGLYGRPDGLVTLDYKFCIPMNDEFKNDVTKIDTTINFQKGTGIKDGCSENEYLCIGNTHQKNFRDVLINLASLEYVEKIEQIFWEQ